MADDFSKFKHGGVAFPIPSATTNGLLKDVDPALFYVLAFYESVLNTHLSTRLAAEASAIGYAAISAAVRTSLPYHPGPFLTESQIKFPALAVYRRTEQHAERTLSWRHTTSEWGVSYVLPPLNAMQAERLAPALNAAKIIIENRTEMGWDAGYLSGSRTFSANFANLEAIDIRSSQFELWDLGKELPFHALTMTLVVKERAVVTTGTFESLSRMDTDIALPDHEDDENVVQTRLTTSVE